jgi:hypothetical protein
MHMKTAMISLLALALAGTAALAQNDDPGYGMGQRPRKAMRAERAERNRPGGPISPEMRAEIRAQHQAIRELGRAARNETDEAKKAELVQELRDKLADVADRIQQHQETRLAQAEEHLAELKERIEYARDHRDELIEEHLQNILAGKRPARAEAFDRFPNAKGGRGMPPPPPPEGGPEFDEGPGFDEP